MPNDPYLTDNVFMEIQVDISSILLKCFQGYRDIIRASN
jgi:hypothetical protein